MVDFVRVWNWYSRESVRRALLEVAKNREVVFVYKDLSYGKRPNTLQYEGDVLQAIAEGTVAFHGSVERWRNPMELDVGMSRQQLDSLRTGWDLLIDPDVKDFQIAKIVTLLIVKTLQEHGVKNIYVKYTGGKGFHIAVPFESFPQKVNDQPIAKLYPEIYEKIIEYLKWCIREPLKEALLELDTPNGLSQRVGKPLDEILSTEGIDPFKIVSLDVFGSRHLFRLPYSLHEKSLLVSLPIEIAEIKSFEKEQAQIEKAKVRKKFLVEPKYEGDAEGLVIEALDWYSRHAKKEVKIATTVRTRRKRGKKIPEEYFPPCIKKILSGLSDGRKRSIFVLVTFLRNMGWSLEEIEERLNEWNKANKPPLRDSYLRTQLRWHFRQERNLLPPNCDNPIFYKDMNVCQPDKICLSGIKNPINYAFKAFKKEYADAKLIVVPRHPERFAKVAGMIETFSQDQTLSWHRYSQNSSLEDDIILIDVLGELVNVYAISDVVVLGGAFEPIGGHNAAEAAQFGCKIISGPHYFNQKDIFEAVEGIAVVEASNLSRRLSQYGLLKSTSIKNKSDISPILKSLKSVL